MSETRLVPAALTRAVAQEMAALALLRRGEPVPILVLRELSTQFAEQLRTFGFGPARQPGAPWGDNHLALSTDLICFAFQEFFTLFNQLDRDDLQHRGRLTNADIAFARDVIGDFLAEDARQEALHQQQMDDGGDMDGGPAPSAA